MTVRRDDKGDKCYTPAVRIVSKQENWFLRLSSIGVEVVRVYVHNWVSGSLEESKQTAHLTRKDRFLFFFSVFASVNNCSTS